MNTMLFRKQKICFTPHRIKEADRKPNKYYYELRHGDDWGEPETIEKSVMVNFYGTIIADKPITLKEKSYNSEEPDYTVLKKKEKQIFM